MLVNKRGRRREIGGKGEKKRKKEEGERNGTDVSQ
jgi:hypothetical protein